jgi:hypothetical protein
MVIYLFKEIRYTRGWLWTTAKATSVTKTDRVVYHVGVEVGSAAFEPYRVLAQKPPFHRIVVSGAIVRLARVDQVWG